MIFSGKVWFQARADGVQLFTGLHLGGQNIDCMFLSKMDERKMSICPKDKYILSSFYKCDVVLSTYLSVMTSPRKIPGVRIILYIRFIYILM